MSLFALTYVSASTHMLSATELKSLMKVSEDRNRLLGITGMLLYRDGYFIQVLEGEQETVEALYNKIVRDPRHINAVVVSREQIQTRSFGAWSMGVADIERMDVGDLRKMDGFSEYLAQPFTLDSFRHNPTRATRLLEMFKSYAI